MCVCVEIGGVGLDYYILVFIFFLLLGESVASYISMWRYLNLNALAKSLKLLRF